MIEFLSWLLFFRPMAQDPNAAYYGNYYGQNYYNNQYYNYYNGYNAYNQYYDPYSGYVSVSGVMHLFVVDKNVMEVFLKFYIYHNFIQNTLVC